MRNQTNPEDFLRHWPSLRPAIERLVDSAVNAPPEASQTARDVVSRIIGRADMRGEFEDHVALVQRAMDAAVSDKEKERAAFEAGCDSAKRDSNEWHGKYLANQTSNVNLRAEVARLSKELAEEREKCKHMQIAFDNAALANRTYRDVDRQLAAAQSKYKELHAEFLREEEGRTRALELLDESRSALAEKEKELAEEKVHWAAYIDSAERLFDQDKSWPMWDVIAKLRQAVEHLKDVHDCDTHGHEQFWGALDASKEYPFRLRGISVRLAKAEHELSTERAARQKAVRERDEAMTAAYHFHADETVLMLRRKLQQAEQERDEARKELRTEKICSEAIKRADCAMSDCGHNQQYLWSPDGVGKHIVCAVCQNSSLRAELAATQGKLALETKGNEAGLAAIAVLTGKLHDATCGQCVCSSCGKTVNNAWRDDDGHLCLTCLAKQRNEAEERCVTLAEERDGLKGRVFRLECENGDILNQIEDGTPEEVQLIKEVSVLRTQLAATQETVRRVERERDEWHATASEQVRDTVKLTAAFNAERDALQKQNASLTSELAAVRVCFAEASQSAGPTTVHVERLKARNAELVKERDELARKLPVISQRIAVVVEAAFREGYMARAGTVHTQAIDLPWNISRSKEVLNQSPE